VGLGGIERYDVMLSEFVRRLQVADVYFTGKVTDAELAAYYQIADLLLCLSEHEGFNVPLVEAMHLNVPILAYNCTSIPYTLGAAGVLANVKHYAEIAEMMHLIMTDETFRAAILAAQRQRLRYFAKSNLAGLLQTYLNQALAATETTRS